MALKKILHTDMDGVLADFESGLAHTGRLFDTYILSTPPLQSP